MLGIGVSEINLLVIFVREAKKIRGLGKFCIFAICVCLTYEYMLDLHRIRRPLSTELLVHIRTLGEIMAMDRLKRGLGD